MNKTTTVQEEQLGDYLVKVVIDENPEDPRKQFDHLSKFCFFHRRHSLPNETEYKAKDFSGWDSMREQILKDGAALCLPVFMYDHSGLTISTDSSRFRAIDPDKWDWGQIGFAFITEKDFLNEYGVDRDMAIELATKVLEGEVEEYDQFLQGSVYGYIIEDKHGDEVASAWGYYGDADYCMQEAKQSVPKE